MESGVATRWIRSDNGILNELGSVYKRTVVKCAGFSEFAAKAEFVGVVKAAALIENS